MSYFTMLGKSSSSGRKLLSGSVLRVGNLLGAAVGNDQVECLRYSLAVMASAFVI
jgi:hypothetical protein